MKKAFLRRECASSGEVLKISASRGPGLHFLLPDAPWRDCLSSSLGAKARYCGANPTRLAHAQQNGKRRGRSLRVFTQRRSGNCIVPVSQGQDRATLAYRAHLRALHPDRLVLPEKIRPLRYARLPRAHAPSAIPCSLFSLLKTFSR